MSEPTKPRRPWWAAALIGGAAAGATIVAAVGPRAARPEAIAAPVSDVSERLGRMELILANQAEALADVREKLGRIEGRLERR